MPHSDTTHFHPVTGNSGPHHSSSSPSKDHFGKLQPNNAQWRSSSSSSSSSLIGRLAAVLLNRKNVLGMALLCATVMVVLRQSPVVTNAAFETKRSTKEVKNPIRLIAILGERNSGTRWTFEYVYGLLLVVVLFA
jgi:hypothetical protein